MSAQLSHIRFSHNQKKSPAATGLISNNKENLHRKRRSILSSGARRMSPPLLNKIKERLTSVGTVFPDFWRELPFQRTRLKRHMSPICETKPWDACVSEGYWRKASLICQHFLTQGDKKALWLHVFLIFGVFLCKANQGQTVSCLSVKKHHLERNFLAYCKLPLCTQGPEASGLQHHASLWQNTEPGLAGCNKWCLVGLPCGPWGGLWAMNVEEQPSSVRLCTSIFPHSKVLTLN